MSYPRLTVHAKHIRDRRWDVLGMGLQRLEKLCGDVDLTTFEPFVSMRKKQESHGSEKVHQNVLKWMDDLDSIAKANNAKFHVFSVDIPNKNIIHDVTSDVEEVENAEVDMT